jgi:hypothetical protein
VAAKAKESNLPPPLEPSTAQAEKRDLTPPWGSVIIVVVEVGRHRRSHTMADLKSRIDQSGLYHAVANIGAKRSKDGADHSIPFSFQVQKQPKGWSDEEYEMYLAGADLAHRAIASRESKLEKVASLTPEEKAANKVARAAQREKDGQLKALMAEAGVKSPQALRDLLKKAGVV